VPYPADYGGVIDVFYKIKTLHELGIKIHLHCFEYGRGMQLELENYCIEVNYYHRNEGHKGFSHKLPYIVCSRSNRELTENLLKDNHPVILEGIHCTYILNDDRFRNRKIILRLHNVEHEYYRQLYQHEKFFFKKMYYFHESRLLKKYEESISGKALIIAMAEEDADKYSSDFATKDIFHLPVFHSSDKAQCQEGTGCYCLYHGNLSVAENEAAAIWLLQKVFNDLDVPFVIAGKNPSEKLRRLAHQHHHTCLVENPGEQEMKDMICKAQINIIPSFNHTGIKLKLLSAVFNGRHCIANENAAGGTGLEKTCHMAESAEDFKKTIMQLYRKPFYYEEIKSRESLLSGLFNNKKNGQKLIEWIW
jgi:glycosyl transferase family 1